MVLVVYAKLFCIVCVPYSGMHSQRDTCEEGAALVYGSYCQPNYLRVAYGNGTHTRVSRSRRRLEERQKDASYAPFPPRLEILAGWHFTLYHCIQPEPLVCQLQAGGWKPAHYTSVYAAGSSILRTCLEDLDVNVA
ncbi:hypothetical protein HIM_08932 [Hirsutella minnesotensis 3608]|uniref:Uncharacterized protein n=1 Tax=Hirsutella minnesotensis 3608 TaxID=1043627 RepID=A0A0F7ZGX9_9HYPO|nr:hypothetical protein HIM_08932 [Hirsutella minnesotensis 3608]